MIVYSHQIIRFIEEIKEAVKTILTQEVRVKVGRNRFLDLKRKNSYPIQVVIFNHRPMLGYFDPQFYELGFHESLMHVKKEQLYQIIRHELAHYLAYILHGEGIDPHGPEFRQYCKQLGWGEEVYRATICLEGAQENAVESSSVLKKVQKLMALSTSSNPHEAEAAMIKSQQLLLKHNIDSSASSDEEKFVLKRLLKQKKENAKMRCIAKILETFFVNIVFNRAQDCICLEIVGSTVNVEIATYVADVLQLELENLWGVAQKQSHLKGMVAKNSFFLGLAKGYCNKIHALKREYSADTTNALVVIEKGLMEAKELVYPRLSALRSGGRYCPKSSAVGERAGKQLNINPGLNRSSGNIIGYLK